VAQGFLQSIAPCDDAGNVIATPADPKARSLRFAASPNVADPPQDQLELKADVESALSAIQRIYPDSLNEADFRRYFVRIAGAAQVGLVGASCYSELGKQALSGVISDLIDQEGAQVKNKHLRALAVRSVYLSIPLLILYVIFRFFIESTGLLRHHLGILFLSADMVSSFVIMLAGCLLGVTLSYAARTTILTLKDLTTPDVEQLRPYSRLLVSAGWALLFGYLVVLDVFVIQIGSFSTNTFATNPMVAFVLGAVCGLSNLTLPGVVSKKAAETLSLK
jgi:hypothetical protein